MAETIFTPGPWQGCLHLRSNADETCGCGYRGGIWSVATDTMICEIGGPINEQGADMIPRGDRATQIADHWLIVASPDLYAACLEAASRLRYSGDLFHDQGLQSRAEADWAASEACFAACSKARGESPAPSPR